MYSVIPEGKPGRSGLPALFLPLHSPFTVSCRKMGGGEKEPLKERHWKGKDWDMIGNR